MNILVTGGVGFIGRWVVKNLLDKNHYVFVVDNLSNSSEDNIEEFKENSKFRFIKGDILDNKVLSKIFDNKFDICIHLAAQIDVQESLDNPQKAFDVNAKGTFNLLEKVKNTKTKFVFISTCMVYDVASSKKAIDETHPVKPISPYAGSKLAAENLVMSFHYGFGLPSVIIRPFNTYGPFQRPNLEGSVVGLFLKKNIKGEILDVFGDGKQTRDFLYVEDCAEFVVKSALSEEVDGQIINAGLGKDISINNLAFMITKDNKRIKHVTHHHPRSEIQKLLCDYSKAKRILGWSPRYTLEEGIKKTEEWIKNEGGV